MKHRDHHPAPPPTAAHDESHVVVPVVEETVRIEKEVVQTGGVRVRKTVHSDAETVEVPLNHDELEVERVQVGRVIDDPRHAPKPRQEGDVYIVPVLEEVAVVEKRLVLREELHIRKKQTRAVHRETVEVRREEAEVERLPKGAARPGETA